MNMNVEIRRQNIFILLLWKIRGGTVSFLGKYINRNQPLILHSHLPFIYSAPYVSFCYNAVYCFS
jgi:hypothetical protein